jgi:hypothetical protein
MELLDRYLNAVAKHLPMARRDDIVAELRANLESQLEEKEEELGRPLTAAEAQEWVKKLEPPIQMAARYQPARYLIGPGLYPTYRYVLRMGLMWCVVIYCIVQGIELLVEPSTPESIASAIFHIPWALIMTAAWITAIFAALEFAMIRQPQLAAAASRCQWSPADLPAVELRTDGGKKPRSFAQAVGEVIFGILWLGWLSLIPWHPFLIMGPGAWYVQTSPYQLVASVWWPLFWVILALNLVQIGWRAIDLARGAWRRPNRAQQVVIAAIGLIPVVLLWSAPALVALRNPEVNQAKYGATLDSINGWAHRSFLLILIIAALNLAWEVGRSALAAHRRRSTSRH